VGGLVDEEAAVGGGDEDPGAEEAGPRGVEPLEGDAQLAGQGRDVEPGGLGVGPRAPLPEVPQEASRTAWRRTCSCSLNPATAMARSTSTARMP
jgi:hypothetical protein